MKKFTVEYNGFYINIIADPGVVLFRVDDLASAVGYSGVGPVLYHVKNRMKLVAGQRFVDLKTIKHLAKRATRTPTVKDFASWARHIHENELAAQKAAEHIAKQNKPHADEWPSKPKTLNQSITESAKLLGMEGPGQLKDWLIAEGYADTYRSNGNLKLSKWFKSEGYGVLPIGESGRVSNTPRLTPKGVEFIRNRLASQREGNVLSFARSNAAERKRLEAEIDTLIKSTFANYKYSEGYGHYGPPEYLIAEDDLIKKIKGVIAEVKLKEVKNGSK
jgi:hypothetical protein